MGRLLTAASMYLLLLVVSGCGAVVVDAAHDPPGENAGSGSPSSPGSPGSQPGPPAAAIAISGQPATTVTVGSTYTFTPSATESGPGVVFSITHSPAWLTFAAGTGKLSGIPAQSDVGTYPGIVISVTDGASSASLPAFSVAVQPVVAVTGTASLAWDAPVANVDGSVLTDLSGYTVAYGTSPNALTQTVTLNDAHRTSYTVTGLQPGTWYFAVRALALDGAQSAYSDIASTAIK